MRDYKVLSVRLSRQEAQAMDRLARDRGLTVSELVRWWLEQAASLGR
jgi:hypothetical protein